jgi:hypothetical protein
MFGSSDTLPEQDQRPLGQFSNRSATNEMGRVLPNVYGRQRIGCTFISEFFDITAQEVTTGGKHSQDAGTNYYASFAVAVGHGPFNKFCDLYLNGDSVFTTTTPLYAVALSQNNNVATFQTANPHGLSTGDTVDIYYAFQPEFNGEFVITVVSPTQFQYTIPGSSIPAQNATAQNGYRIYALVKLDPISRISNETVYGPKVTISGITSTASISTCTTVQPHGLQPGNTVAISGVNQGGYNGTWTVQTTPDKYTFTFAFAGSANGTGGYLQLVITEVITADVTTITIPDYGTADIHWGTLTQPVNQYLSTVSGVRHPPYKGICYLVFHQLFLGFNQTNCQNVEVVMERQPQFAWQSNHGHEITNANYGDCNPASIVADMLLNPRNGLGLDPDKDVNTASLDAAIEQFYSEGIGFAPIATRGDELRSQCVSILENVDAAITLDDCGKLAISIARLPDNPPTVTDANLTDLPTFTPSDWSSVTNETYLTYVDQDAGWVQDYVIWKDNAAIYGKERAEPQTLDRPMVTHQDLAIQLAAIFGQVGALPTTTGKLQLAYSSQLFDALAPGNAFQFEYDLRPSLNATYRVTSRSLPDPTKPIFEIEVAIDRSYLYSQANGVLIGSGVSQPGGGSGQNNSPPVPDLQPIPAPSPSAIVELPLSLVGAIQGFSPAQAAPAIAALVTRALQSDAFATLYLGRNYVFNGTPPASFLQLAALTGFAFTGTLTADFPASTPFIAIANPLPAEAGNVGQSGFPLAAGLQIQLIGIDLILPGVSDFDALANTVLLFVGDEIMSIAEAEMTDSGAYSLTVIRGRFGTPIEDHASGDTVWIITQANLKPLQHPHFLAGNNSQFKLTIGDQDIADVTAFDVTFVGNRWPGTKDASGTWTADSTNITADQN